MSKRTACALYLSFMALPALAQTAAEPATAFATAAPQTEPQGAEAQEAAPARIVVSGRRPGPGLWKVSKGNHVMWVFGLYSPLPQKMEWDAGRVERLVAQSQEVLKPPVANLEVGFFRSLTLLPGMIGMKKNPDGARLHDILPADVYARWTTLKSKYIGDDKGVEAYRPFFAGEELLQAALKKTGLSQGYEVRKQIETIAEKNKVKLSFSGIEMEVENPNRLLKDFKKGQMEDVACFTRTLDSLEADVETMRVRANAWANGDIAEINALDYRERDDACNDAVLNASFAKNDKAFQNVPERVREAWLKKAEQSLAVNATTFAMLQMKNIVDPAGYLAALQARGYTVESPK
jgi:hypothetical protein